MDNFGQPADAPNTPSPENYKLKWHKFLIYFSLWAGAVMNVYSGIRSISGAQYGTDSAQVYAYYGGSLKALDTAMGLVLLVLAVYTVYTRFQLAGFKIDAPRKLTVLYTANLVASVLYLLAASAVTKLPLSSFMSDMIGTIIGSIAMIFINQNYYNKRMELFVN